MAAPWPAPAGLHTTSARLPVEGPLPSFEGATGWLNSPPLTPAALRGNVVLASFWTYTCINWLRQLPYLRAWHAKYFGKQGEQVVKDNLTCVRRGYSEMKEIPASVIAGNG